MSTPRSHQYPLPVPVSHGGVPETEEEALRISSSRNLSRLQAITGRGKGISPVEEAVNYQYTPDELAFVQQYQRVCGDGDPQQVKQHLDDIAELYQTPDLSVVTITHDFADRVRSYELVADVCGIKAK